MRTSPSRRGSQVSAVIRWTGRSSPRARRCSPITGWIRWTYGTDRRATVPDVLLSYGTAVHLRQISPGDADGVVAMHSRFSERTRYLRYFSPYPRIPPRDLERFTNVDHVSREALVVVVGSDLIGVGR